MQFASITTSAIAALALAAAACGSFLDSATPGTDAGPEAAPPAADAGAGDGAVGADAGDAADGSTGPVPPTELAKGLEDLSGIAVTESAVYVSQRTIGNVMAVKLDGSGPPAVFAASGGSTTGLAVAGSYLFWCDFGGGRLIRSPLAGGALTTATPTPGKSSFQIATALDRIVTVAVDGANMGEVQQYTFDLSAGPSLGALANPYDVAVFEGAFYFTESSGSRIGKGMIGNGSNTDFATSESGPESITADKFGVYWARPLIASIRARPTAGAGAVTLAANELGPHSLASDGTAVYWLTNGGTVRRSTHADGAITTLASGYSTSFTDAHVQALAVTSKYVVWITTDGRVMRVPK